MPSQVALSSVFRLALNILCSTFNYLYLFESIFPSSLQRWFSCSFCVYLCYTLEVLFHKKFKNDKWSNYCLLSVRKILFHILLERDHCKLLIWSLARHGLKKVQKVWLWGHWRIAQNLLGRRAIETFCSLTSFKSCIHPCVCIIGHI